MPYFDYDYYSDSLYISKTKEKVKGSIRVGDFIMDISFDTRVIGLEILNASKNLGTTKKSLKNIKKAKIRTILKRDFFGVAYMVVGSKKPIKDSEIVLPLEKPIAQC